MTAEDPRPPGEQAKLPEMRQRGGRYQKRKNFWAGDPKEEGRPETGRAPCTGKLPRSRDQRGAVKSQKTRQSRDVKVSKQRKLRSSAP